MLTAIAVAAWLWIVKGDPMPRPKTIWGNAVLWVLELATLAVGLMIANRD